MLIPAFPSRIEAVVVGASAGAIEALSEILPALPGSTPFAVVVVVHLPPTSPSSLASLFAHRCPLPTREAFDKEPLGRGIWFAPPDYHLLVEKERTFALSIDPPVHHSRPSVDVLFASAADVYGASLVAVVLTGANGDGAEGARVVRERGGFVVAQDPATAKSPEMPRVAIKRASPQLVASPTEIGRALRDAALRSTA